MSPIHPPTSGNSAPTALKPERNVPLPRTLSGSGAAPTKAPVIAATQHPMWLGLKPVSRAMLVLFVGAVVALPPVTLGHSGATWPIVAAAVNLFFSLGLAGLVSFFVYFIFKKSPRIGNAAFCLCMSFSIAQVCVTSARFNKTIIAELKSRGYDADKVMAGIQRQVDSLPFGPASADAAQSGDPATFTPTKKGSPVVRVYKKP